MNQDQSADAGEPAPEATTKKKLDLRTLLTMVAVFGGLAALIAFNMK